ncbi:MAG: ATP-binding protein [Candidatus Binatia bacterium]
MLHRETEEGSVVARVISFPRGEAFAWLAHRDSGLTRANASPLLRTSPSELRDFPLVGREREMAELRASLEDACAGHGRLVLLVGDAGIGKTRTAHELATVARMRHVQVLLGRCYEGEGAPPFWPWVQIVRAYIAVRTPETLQAKMGADAADIAQVIPEVRERLPDLPTPPELEPQQTRFRFFDGFTTFLKKAATEQPLVLILDDLHWADKPSLLLLQFMARQLADAHILIVGTYRDAEVGPQHPLAQTLGEVARERTSRSIALHGLTAQDVAQFIQLTTDQSPSETVVAAVYQKTEGNPFFMTEVVRSLAARSQWSVASEGTGDRVQGSECENPQSTIRNPSVFPCACAR